MRVLRRIDWIAFALPDTLPFFPAGLTLTSDSRARATHSRDGPFLAASGIQVDTGILAAHIRFTTDDPVEENVVYIQVTTRCNMTCAHCCYACTAKGVDMKTSTFDAALRLAVEYDSSVALGGGEPTLHKRFWDFLGKAIAHAEYVWLATNGSNTKTALALAKLAEKGIIGCALSQDEWHDPIDPEVVAAFTKPSRTRASRSDDRDCREVRTATEDKLSNSGRCDFGTGGFEPASQCPCPDLFVAPDGSIKACGCEDSPVIGHVENGIDVRWCESGAAFSGECFRSSEVEGMLEEYDQSLAG